MKIRLLVLCGLALLAACSSKPKGPPPWNPYSAGPPRDENYHGGSVALLKRYDANHDGTLTREELLAGLHAEFDAADPGKTGCLAPEQVFAINQQRVDADQSIATPLQDWNQDGCVDFKEFAAAPVSMFDQVDRNGDGKITPQEFGPAKPGASQSDDGAGRGGRGGGRRGGGPPQ